MLSYLKEIKYSRIGVDTSSAYYHLQLLRDDFRLKIFKNAISRIVKPGDVVLDLGTGTGILATFAAAAGARRVYAVEASPIHSIAENIFSNLASRTDIKLIKGTSQNIFLPEQCDVLITETIGNLCFEEGIIDSITDAKARFLKPNAEIIPEHLIGYATPVAEQSFNELMYPKLPPSAHPVCVEYFNNDLFNHAYLELNQKKKNWLSRPMPIFKFDLKCPINSNFIESFDSSYAIENNGEFNAFVFYFRASLCEGIYFNSLEASSWGEVFLPIGHPLFLSVGDIIQAKWSFDRVANGFTIGCQITVRSAEKNGHSFFHKWSIAEE